jgi:hypothetical protein
MRSVIFYQSPSSIEEIDIKNLGFGSSYKGTHNVWTFRFSPDRSDVYVDNDGNSIGQLIEDIHEVPVIRNLKETINIHKAIFDCKDGKFKNTIIKALQGTI